MFLGTRGPTKSHLPRPRPHKRQGSWRFRTRFRCTSPWTATNRGGGRRMDPGVRGRPSPKSWPRSSTGRRPAIRGPSDPGPFEGTPRSPISGMADSEVHKSRMSGNLLWVASTLGHSEDVESLLEPRPTDHGPRFFRDETSMAHRAAGLHRNLRHEGRASWSRPMMRRPLVAEQRLWPTDGLDLGVLAAALDIGLMPATHLSASICDTVVRSRIDSSRLRAITGSITLSSKFPAAPAKATAASLPITWAPPGTPLRPPPG